MAGIGDLTPYRDPRNAFNNGVRSSVASTASIPVGQATELSIAKPVLDPRTAAGRAAAAPRTSGVPGLSVRELPPGAVPREFAGTPAATSIGQPPPVSGVAQGAATGIADAAAPSVSRLGAMRAALNTAIPSANIGAPTGAIGRSAMGAMKFAGRASTPLAMGYEALNTGLDVATPGMTGTDQLARVAEGAGRIGGAGAGALAGSAAGTALLPGFGTVAGGLLGGAAGYFAPDLANKAYNAITGNSNELASDTAGRLRAAQSPQGIAAPVQQIPTPQNVPSITSPVPATQGVDAGAGRGFVNQNPVAQVAPANTALNINAGMPNISDLAPSQAAALSDARLAAAGQEPGQVNAGAGGFRDSATEERNARLARQNPLDRLESAARLASSPRERAAALGAYAQLAGGFDQSTTQQNVAQLRESGDTQRAIAANTANLTIHGNENATARRGQDIGLQGHQLATQGAQAIEQMRAGSARDVANITSEGRIDAAVNRAQRPIALRGGQVPYTDPATGLTTMMTLPDRFVDPNTMQEVGAPAKPAPAWASDPKVMAIKNDPKMSDADKRAALQALGYK